MATYGQSITITYVAWDTANNVGKTGDSANHTLRWIKDGTSAPPTNSPSEVDATNAKGVYKLTLTAAECQTFQGTLAGISSTSDISIMPVQIMFVHLPAVAPDAAGGLPISDAGGLDLDTLLGRLDAAITSRMATFSLPTNFADLSITPTSGYVAINEDGSSYTAIPWNADWDAEVESEVNDGLVALGLDHLVGASVTGTDIVDNSIIAKIVSASATADWDDFVNTTDSLQAVRDHIGDGTNLTEAGGTGDHLSAIPWNASWDAEVQSECTDALNAYDPPTKAETDALLTTALTEGYAADGSTFTLSQGMYMLWSALAEFSISGTTITCKQLDGSTSAMTFTLDDASNPTSRTRAT